MNILIEKFERNNIINGRFSKGLVSLYKISIIFDFRRLHIPYDILLSAVNFTNVLRAAITREDHKSAKFGNSG
jgi:hypothetical protein